MNYFLNPTHKIINTTIVLFFFLSILISKYNLTNYDKNIHIDDYKYHQMIKTDSYRYMSQGAEIKRDLDNGINFFKTGPESYTKYLPSRIAAAYYYFFDLDLFNNFEEKKINLGIHFFYLIIQCFAYYLSLFFLSLTLIKIFNKKIVLFTIIFLAAELTILQYHGTFWSESYFFSLQIILLTLVLNKINNNYNFFFIGFFLGLLSLQKQMAFFYIVPIIVYFFFLEIKKKPKKLFIIFFGWLIVQLFLGTNNYIRSGKFYLLTADTKLDLHRDLVEVVMSNKNNITRREFAVGEGDIAIKWIKDNFIPHNELKVQSSADKLTYMDYRGFISSESDKVEFDNFIRNRTFKYIYNYPKDFILHITKRSFHSGLLNPFHIYSDHNFRSGEMYYETSTHKKLIPYRIVYSIFIYLISILGLFYLFKNKKYNLLFLLFLSISYFFFLVSWHGNTRYFVPVLIYISLLFGHGSFFLFAKSYK
jgi:hypothetical protein